MVHYLRDTSAPMQDCTCGESDHPKPDAWPTGIFRDEERADYGSLYSQKVAMATARKATYAAERNGAR